MPTLFTKATLALALGASALAVSAPAQAQRYDRGYRGHDNGGTALVAGVAGLAIGAALASNNSRGAYYEDRGYDEGYYDRGPGYRPVYNGYYREYDGYYDPRGGYDRRGDYYRHHRDYRDGYRR